MNGPWHYKEAERLLTEAAGAADPWPVLIAAQTHATLASTAATAQAQLFDDDDTQEWFAVFDGEAVVTAEQAAAIVDANLSQMGVTLGGERYRGPCHDPQCGDSTWDHECPLPPGDYQVTNGITHAAGVER